MASRVVGCGSHTVQILDRSGAVVAASSTLLQVRWTRVLDDISTATAVIMPDSGDCCGDLGDVRTWRHNLAIWRSGELVWQGPIIQASWKVPDGTTVTGLEVRAGDVLSWLDRRVPHRDMRFNDTDLTTIAEALIADGFAPDDPGHQVHVVGWSRVRGDREYFTDIGQTGDHLRDLADTGLDYTAVGPTIILLPEDHLETVGTLTDVDFPTGLGLEEDGASLGTRWVVEGKQAQDGEPTIVGTAGGADPFYGLLERYVQQTSILDDASAVGAARSRLRGSLPVPVWLDSERVTLSPEAAVSVPDLVPGWCVDVATRATCRKFAGRLKIVGLQITETGTQGESIEVHLAPTGAGEIT